MLLILINCIQEGLHARSMKKWNVLRFPLRVLWAISLSGRDSGQQVGCSQPGTRPAKATQQTIWALSLPFTVRTAVNTSVNL